MNLNQLPVVVRRQIKDAKFPPNFEAMKKAVLECASIDQLVDMRDKTAAMASYAKQIRDTALEDGAIRIKTRAECAIGDLMLLIPSQKGKAVPGLDGRYQKRPWKSSRQLAAESAGLSEPMAGHYMSMARAPMHLREKLIERTPPARGHEIRALGVRHRRGHSMNPENSLAYATVVASTFGLASFARFTERFSASEYAPLIADGELQKVRRYMAQIEDWLDEFEQHLPKGKA